MPKAAKKLSTILRRKRRPKSVYAKGWETRRANKAALEEFLGQKTVQALKKGLAPLTNDPDAAKAAGWSPVTVAEAAQMGAVHSEQRGDAVISLLAIHRDEQLCCFLADIMQLRKCGMPAHAPIMVTRSQVEALEDFLTEHGVTMFGRRPVEKAA